MSLLLGIIIIVAALLGEAFFAGSETGIVSTNRIKLAARADKGDRRAVIIKNFLDNPQRFLGTTLVGVNLSVIISSSVASGLVVRSLVAPDYAPLTTTAIMLPLILIFGEIIPKAIFRQYADVVSLWAAYPLRVAYIILFPIVWVATKFSSLVSMVFTRSKAEKNPYVTREEMRILLGESAKEGFLTTDELKMAYEVFDFGITDARSVMVPLSSIVSASHKAAKNELAELIAMSGYSRIPVYKDKPDNIIGTVQVSDLITEGTEDYGIAGIMRKPYIVDEAKNIDELLKEFQTNQKNIAIVTNKQNQAVGIVTLEDIVEEIVGEIEDEYDAGDQTG